MARRPNRSEKLGQLTSYSERRDYVPSDDCRSAIEQAIGPVADEDFYRGIAFFVKQWARSESYRQRFKSRKALKQKLEKIHERLGFVLREWSDPKDEHLIALIGLPQPNILMTFLDSGAEILKSSAAVEGADAPTEGRPQESARRQFILNVGAMLDLREIRVSKGESGALAAVLQAVFADLQMPEIEDYTQLIKGTFPDEASRRYVSLVLALTGGKNFDNISQFVPRYKS